MENLVSRDAYDVDETGYLKRMPLVAGLFMAIFCGLGFGVLFPLVVGKFSLLTALFIGLGFGIPVGLLFALIFRILFRRKVSAFVDAIYADNSKIVLPPPAGKDFSHRVFCNWMKSDNFAVGGVLYVGKDSLMFVPHKQNLPQHQEPFEVAPLNDAKFSIVEPQINLLHRTLTERPPRYIEVKWFGGKARFLILEAEQTLKKIKNIIETKQLK